MVNNLTYRLKLQFIFGWVSPGKQTRKVYLNLIIPDKNSVESFELNNKWSYYSIDCLEIICLSTRFTLSGRAEYCQSSIESIEKRVSSIIRFMFGLIIVCFFCLYVFCWCVTKERIPTWAFMVNNCGVAQRVCRLIVVSCALDFLEYWTTVCGRGYKLKYLMVAYIDE